MTMQTYVPVAIGVVDSGVGINFGRRHGLEGNVHNEFLRDVMKSAGFVHPETVQYKRNKQGDDGRMYVDWMRIRISSDECQVNGVNPQDAVMKLRVLFRSKEFQKRYSVEFRLN